MNRHQLRAAFDNIPIHSEKYYAYGTAGFRSLYEESLHQLFIRVGMIAALRSFDCYGKCTGIMVTASHNLERDNGVKIVDVDGGMLTKNWESLSERLANLPLNEFLEEIEKMYTGLSQNASQGIVMVGWDTRTHSPILVDCVGKGIKAVGGVALHLGEVITPALHFCVDAFNRTKTRPQEFQSEVILLNYYKELLGGYQSLTSTADHPLSTATPRTLVLDASFGVGSITVEQFLTIAQENGGIPGWQIEVRNKAREGSVNANCGAEHAQKLQQPPLNVSAIDDQGKLLCSFDGDGDRIVFHVFLEDGWHLLDGDRIAVLIASFLQEELLNAGVASSLSQGIVQTAYANGASTAFLRKFTSIVFAKTGVKYLHHAAQSLDVGIYFEANGHGTVNFSPRAKAAITAHSQGEGLLEKKHSIAFTRLQACLRVINHTVGDALSDMLTVLAILNVKNMSVEQWLTMYQDLPSKQCKVNVPDKSQLLCSEDEMRLVAPLSLQEELDNAMKKVPQGRCFVRPSGTEDVVRIYAEAETLEGVNDLVTATERALHHFFQ